MPGPSGEDGAGERGGVHDDSVRDSSLRSLVLPSVGVISPLLQHCKPLAGVPDATEGRLREDLVAS